MKIFLDDERDLPEHYSGGDWVLVRHVEDAIKLLEQGNVDEISLDWYLGTARPYGHEVLVWMTEQVKTSDYVPPRRIRMHSSSPAGRDMIRAHNGILEDALKEREARTK